MPARNPKKSRALGFLLSLITLGLTAFALELVLRLYHGSLLDFQSIPHRPVKDAIAQYDPQLGWIPRSGRISQPDYQATVDEAHLRSNGRPEPNTSELILTLGDSFTWGDEVNDTETWPSQLENMLQQRVLNAGVFAYGIDQAFLRAQQLVDTHPPRIIVLAFISHDIVRTELSYYFKSKPYFECGNHGLNLKNVPVPTGYIPSRPLPLLNRAVGYSYLAHAVMKRTPLRGWYAGPECVREHHDGEKVTVELLTQLDRLSRARNIRFVAMTLVTDGRIAGNERLPTVVAGLRQNQVEVLDLAADMLQMPNDDFRRKFDPRGHYNPEMNGWVAARLAKFLKVKSGSAPL